MPQSVTEQGISDKIKDTLYLRPPGTTMTVCILTLQNGFHVTGESAAVDPSNFDAKIGEKIAYQNAFEKIWQLEGYLLKQQIFESKDKQPGTGVDLDSPFGDDGFSIALIHAKEGRRIARRGWNGKGLFVEAQFPDEHSKMGNPYLFIDAHALGGERNPWVPSQTDIFANDWFVVKSDTDWDAE